MRSKNITQLDPVFHTGMRRSDESPVRHGCDSRSTEATNGPNGYPTPEKTPVSAIEGVRKADCAVTPQKNALKNTGVEDWAQQAHGKGSSRTAPAHPSECQGQNATSATCPAERAQIKRTGAGTHALHPCTRPNHAKDKPPRQHVVPAERARIKRSGEMGGNSRPAPTHPFDMTRATRHVRISTPLERAEIKRMGKELTPCSRTRPFEMPRAKHRVSLWARRARPNQEHENGNSPPVHHARSTCEGTHRDVSKRPHAAERAQIKRQGKGTHPLLSRGHPSNMPRDKHNVRNIAPLCAPESKRNVKPGGNSRPAPPALVHHANRQTPRQHFCLA